MRHLKVPAKIPDRFRKFPPKVRAFILSGAVVVIVGIGAIIALLVTGRSFGPTHEAPGRGSPLIGGAFTLIDQDGKTRTQADFSGKLVLIYFGYTFCPDVCPTALQRLSEALDLLTSAEGGHVMPVFVTVDPARDTPEILKNYVAQFHPDLIGLTGTADQIATAAKAYRVYYRKSDQTKDQPDYLIDHSSIIFLMDANGRYAAHFTHETPPEAIAAAVRTTLKRDKR